MSALKVFEIVQKFFFLAQKNDEKKRQADLPNLSSIVFSDEGEILSKFEDPDLKYNQLIRPWKSRLGLFYIKKRSFILDMLLIFITIVAIFKKKIAYSCIVRILKYYNADNDLIRVCRRDKELEPYPPPGSKDIVKER